MYTPTVIHLNDFAGEDTELVGDKPTNINIQVELKKEQCLGSGSVGSARFWLPGSGSAKICGSTDPDPKSKYQPKTATKKILLSKSKSELLKKTRL